MRFFVLRTLVTLICCKHELNFNFLHDGQAKDDRINFKKIILTTNATFY